MELTHDFTVPASVEQAWATFMDLERVGSCFPGATVDSVTADSFSGSVKVKLGPIALVYLGSGSFLERDDAGHRAVIEAKGKDKRGNGTAGATVTIHLTPSGSGTRVDVTTDLAVTGKPAQFGRGVMQDVSDKLLQQFVRCIEGELATPAAPTAEAGAGDAVAGSTGAETAGSGLAAGPDSAPGGGSGLPQPALATGSAGSGSPDVSAQPASGRLRSDAPALPGTPPTTPRVSSSQLAGEADAIDLGATVLPVVLKAYAPHALAALAGLAIGILIGRRHA